MSGKKAVKASSVEVVPSSAKKGLLAFFSSNRASESSTLPSTMKSEEPEVETETHDTVSVITIPESPFVKDVKVNFENQETSSIISLLNTPKELIVSQGSPNDVAASLSEPLAKKLVFPLFQPGFKVSSKISKVEKSNDIEVNSHTLEAPMQQIEVKLNLEPDVPLDSSAHSDEIPEKDSENANVSVEEEQFHHVQQELDETQDEYKEAEEEKETEEDTSGLRRSSRIRHKVNVLMTEIDSDDSDFTSQRHIKRNRHSLSKEEQEQDREAKEREKEAKREAKRLQKEVKEKEKDAKIAAMFLSKEQRQQRKQEEKERKWHEEQLEKERRLQEEKEMREKLLLEQAKEREKRIQESILREKQLNDTMLNAKRATSTSSNGTANQSVDLTETKDFFAARTSNYNKNNAKNSNYSNNKEHLSQNLSATEGEDIWEAYRIIHLPYLQPDAWNYRISNNVVQLKPRDTPLSHEIYSYNNQDINNNMMSLSSVDTVDLTDDICNTRPPLSVRGDTEIHCDTKGELGFFASAGDTAALHTLWLNYCAAHLPRHTTPGTQQLTEKLSCLSQVWDTAVTHVLETQPSCPHYHNKTTDIQLFVRWLKLKRDDLIQRLGFENNTTNSNNNQSKSKKKRAKGGGKRSMYTRRKLNYDESEEEEDGYEDVDSDDNEIYNNNNSDYCNDSDDNTRGRKIGRRRVDSNSEVEDEHVQLFSRLRKRGSARRLCRDSSNSSDEEFDCDVPRKHVSRQTTLSSEENETEKVKRPKEVRSSKDLSGHDTCVPDTDLCQDNVFVLVGVTGSGKSSVAHRVARHLGFTRVIEINNTVCRTPAVVKRQLLETAAAVPNINYNNNTIDNTENYDSDNIIAIDNNNVNGNGKYAAYGLGVIVVDEAELLLEAEEQSLHGTLMKYIHQAKCPVILTCETLPRSLMGLLTVSQIHTRDTGCGSGTQHRENNVGWDTADGGGGVAICHRNIVNMLHVSRDTVSRIVRHFTHLLTANAVIVCRDTVSWLHDCVSQTLQMVCHGDLRVAMTLLQQAVTHAIMSQHNQTIENNPVTIDITDENHNNIIDNNRIVIYDENNTKNISNNSINGIINSDSVVDSNDDYHERDKNETAAAVSRWTQYLAEKSYCDFAIFDTLSYNNTAINKKSNDTKVNNNILDNDKDTRVSNASLCLLVAPRITQIHPVAVTVSSCGIHNNNNIDNGSTSIDYNIEKDMVLLQIEGKHFLHRDTTSSSSAVSVFPLEICIGTQRATQVTCVSDECITASLTVSQIKTLGPGCHRVSVHLCRNTLTNKSNNNVYSVSQHSSDCVFTVLISPATQIQQDTVVTPLSLATLQTNFHAATRSFMLYKQQHCVATHPSNNYNSYSARKRKRRATVATYKKNKRFKNKAINNLQKHRNNTLLTHNSNNGNNNDSELMDTDNDDNNIDENDDVEDCEDEEYGEKDNNMDDDSDDVDEGDRDSEAENEAENDGDEENEENYNNSNANNNTNNSGDENIDNDTISTISQESLSAMLLQAETQRHLLLKALVQLSYKPYNTCNNIINNTNNIDNGSATQSLREFFDRDTLPQIVATQDTREELSWLELRHSVLDMVSQVDVLQTKTVSRHSCVEDDDTEVSFETQTPGLRDTLSSVSQVYLCDYNNRSVFVSSCVAECVARHIRQTNTRNITHKDNSGANHYQQYMSHVAEDSQLFRDTLRRNVKFTSLVTQQYVCPPLWATSQQDVLRHRFPRSEILCRVELLPCIAVWAKAAAQLETHIATQTMIQRVSRHSSRRSLSSGFATLEECDTPGGRRFPYQRMRDTLYLCSARDTWVCVALGNMKRFSRDIKNNGATSLQEALVEAIFGTIDF